MATDPPPLAAVLAGGRGSRLGGAKATATLAGRPLLAYAVDAASAVADEVVVVAKDGTPLPPLDVPVWREPEAGFHPRHGIVCALRGARGRPVVVVPVDMPLVPSALLEVLIELIAGAPAAVPRAYGRLHPLCAAFAPAALGDFEAAPEDEPLTRTLERMAAHVLDADAVGERLLNVNTPADLARAEALLSRR